MSKERKGKKKVSDSAEGYSLNEVLIASKSQVSTVWV